MRVPGCAAAALRQILRLCVQHKTPASEVLVLCSSSTEAKLLEHLVDVTLPIGSHELLCVGPAGFASAVLEMAPSTAALSSWGGPFATRSLLQNCIYSLPLSSALRPPNDPMRHADDMLAAFDLLQLHDADPVAVSLAAGASGGAAPALVDLAAAYGPWRQLKERARIRDPCDVVQIALHEAAASGSTLNSTPHLARRVQERWSQVVLPDAHNLGTSGLMLLWRLFGQRALAPSSRVVHVSAYVAPHLEPHPGGRMSSLLRRAAAVSSSAGAGAGDSSPPIWEVHEEVGSDAGQRSAQRASAPSPPGAAAGGDVTLSALRLRRCTGVHGVQSAALALEPQARPRAVACVSVLPEADRVAVLAAILELQLHKGVVADAEGARQQRQCRRTVGVFCASALKAVSLAAALSDAVTQRGWGAAVQVVCDGTRRLTDLPGVRAIVAALSAAVAPAADHRPLFALGTGEPYFIPEAHLAALLLRGPAAAAAGDVPASSAARLESLRGHLADARRAYDRTGSVASFVASFLRRSGLGAALTSASSANAEANAAAVAELLGLVQQLEKGAALAVVSGGARRFQRAPAAPAAGAELPAAPAPDGAYSIDTSVPGTLPLVLTQLVDLLTTQRVQLAHSDRVAAALSPDRPWDEQEQLQDGGTASDAAAAAEEGEDSGGAPAPLSSAADVLEAASVTDVLAAVHEQPPALLQPEGEGDADPSSSAAAPMGLTVVVTTMRRGPSHQFDAVVFPWLLDSALPGSLRAPAVTVPEALCQPPQELCDPSGSAPLAAAPPGTREGHVELQRQRLRVAMCASREDVIIVAPAAGGRGSSPLRHARRSRFIDELFGPEEKFDAVPAARPRRRKAPSSAAAPPSGPAALPSCVGAVPAAVVSTPTADEEAGAVGSPSTDVSTASTEGALPVDALAPQSGGDALTLPPDSASLLSHVLTLPPASASLAHVSSPPPPLLSLSFTRLFELQSCPRRFYLARVLRLQQVGTAGMLYGKAMHAAVATFTMALRRTILQACAAEASGSDALSLLESAAAVAGRLAVDPALRAAVRAELPSAEAAAGSMFAEYLASWAGADSGALASTSPAALASLTESVPDPNPLVVPPAQRADLDRCAREGLEAFARREIAAADAYLRDPVASAADSSSGWLGIPALVEHPFALELPEIGVRLRGVIDRVDVQAPSPAAHSIVASAPALRLEAAATVREFKSSVQWAATDALRKRARSNLQLEIYAVALHAPTLEAAPTGQGGLPAPAAHVLSTEMPACGSGGAGVDVVSRLMLESIETGERAVLRRPTKESSLAAAAAAAADGTRTDPLAKARTAAITELSAAAETIRRAEFVATPSLFACGMCPFRAVCSSKHSWA